MAVALNAKTPASGPAPADPQPPGYNHIRAYQVLLDRDKLFTRTRA